MPPSRTCLIFVITSLPGGLGVAPLVVTVVVTVVVTAPTLLPITCSSKSVVGTNGTTMLATTLGVAVLMVGTALTCASALTMTLAALSLSPLVVLAYSFALVLPGRGVAARSAFLWVVCTRGALRSSCCARTTMLGVCCVADMRGIRPSGVGPDTFSNAAGAPTAAELGGNFSVPYGRTCVPADHGWLTIYPCCRGDETVLLLAALKTDSSGRYNVLVNGVQASATLFDDYAAATAPVYRSITLTEDVLPGTNRIDFYVNGKNAASAGFYLQLGPWNLVVL